MAKGKASRIFVWVILGLLFVGLAGFGATNLTGNVRSIGSVGGTSIDVDEYARELSQDINALQAQLGRGVSFPEAQQLGLDQAALARVVGRAALDEEADRLGLSVGDARVAQAVLDFEAFRGLDGNFDRDLYARALRNAGLTEAEFEEDLRADVARGLVQSAVIAGTEAPPKLTALLGDYIGARRDFTWARLDDGALDAPLPDPTEADLVAFYEDNPDAYTLPETRAITYAWLTPEMLIDTIEVPEDELRAMFEEREGDFVSEERRLVERLIFPDDEAAFEAKARIERGDSDFAAEVEARGLRLSDTDLGDVAQPELGAAGAAVFNARTGEVVGPFDTELGPALFRVNAVIPARSVTFEDARELLEEEAAAARARRVIDGQAQGYDDLLAGGATLEELADTTEMVLGQVDYHEGVEDGIAAYAAFREAAEALGEDDFPEIMELDDGGIFALRLDGVIAPRLQPFEDVRAEVAEDWREAETRAAVVAQAEELALQVSGGLSMSALGLTATEERDQTRRGFVPGTPPGFLEAVFALPVGAVEVLPAPDGAIIVSVDRALPPDANDPDVALATELLAEQAAQGIAQDVLDFYMRAVQREAGIELDQGAISAVHANFQTR